MDHSEAVRLMAAERYLLDDLTPELHEGFEEHFFDCQECALDLRAGNAFIGYSKLVLGAAPAPQSVQETAEAKSSGWLAWLRPAFAVPVMAALIAVFFYQNLVTVPQLKSAVAAAHVPQILSTPVYLTVGRGRSADGAQYLVTTRRNQPFTLAFDIPGESRFTSYACEIYSPSGDLEGAVTVSPEAAKDSVSISMYPKRGKSGVFQLVKRGIISGQGAAQSIEIERQSFEVQIQN
jgi:hypothetical protein